MSASVWTFRTCWRRLHTFAANLVPLDFWGQPTDEPVVLAWMPAASLYFRDPDGNLLEFLSMLPDVPQPELGITSWSHWSQSRTRD